MELIHIPAPKRIMTFKQFMKSNERKQMMLDRLNNPQGKLINEKRDNKEIK